MKIIVLGGDGFCGWASSLRLANRGHEVFIFDNLSRRKIDLELKTKSLTPIKSIYKRVETWNKLNKKKIKFFKIDVAKEFVRLEKLIKKNRTRYNCPFCRTKIGPIQYDQFKD